MAAEPPRRELDYTGRAPTSTKGWQLKAPSEERERLQRISTNQQERLAVETPEERNTQFCVTMIILVHVNYPATTWKFDANCFSITEVLYYAVHLMKHVQSDVMWHNKFTWWKTSYRALQYFQNCNIMCRLLLLLFMWYSTARSGSPQDALHLH